MQHKITERMHPQSQSKLGLHLRVIANNSGKLPRKKQDGDVKDGNHTDGEHVQDSVSTEQRQVAQARGGLVSC